MHPPVASHELQIGFWNQAMLASPDKEFKPNDEQQDIYRVEPHHHVLALAHGLELALAKVLAGSKQKLEVLYAVDGYDRASFKIIDAGYVAIESTDKPKVYSVDVSYYVYPESVTTHKAAKKTEKADEEVSETDDDKAQKVMMKTDACIPVVFKIDGWGCTRHYQESMPMHRHTGMTNRLLDTLINDVKNFLLNGDLPAEPK